MIEQELFGVDECPEDVFVGNLGFLFVLLDMGEGDFEFLGHRFAGVNPAVEFFQFLVVRAVFLAG